jgi:hypothetical protein
MQPQTDRPSLVLALRPTYPRAFQNEKRNALQFEGYRFGSLPEVKQIAMF